MRLFLDAFSDEEILSDGYNLQFKFEDACAEVDSKMIVKGGEDIDIGCGNAF